MFIILIVIFLFFLFFNRCTTSFRTKSGRRFKARNLKTAELIDVLRDISIHLSYNINKKLGEKLRSRLQNTSFKEIINGNPNILAWNYNKGREIGVRIYDNKGIKYSNSHIIKALFHELAHSLDDKRGHGYTWEKTNEYLQYYAPKYVKILNLKTKIIV